MRVLIVGAGGHGQVVAEVLLSAAQAGGADQPCGFLDRDERLWNQLRLGLPVLGSADDWTPIGHDAVIVGIGDNRARRSVFASLWTRGERFATARHPSAIVSTSSTIGDGTVVCAGAIVNTAARVGSNVILNTGCSVDHHNQIGDHAHIAPGARLGGDVTIGDGALVGMGAIVLPGRKVGARSIVGAGAVVTEDVPDDAVVVGSPARRCRVHASTAGIARGPHA